MLKTRAFICRKKKLYSFHSQKKGELKSNFNAGNCYFFPILGVARREYGTLRLSPLCEEGKKQPANYV